MNLKENAMKKQSTFAMVAASLATVFTWSAAYAQTAAPTPFEDIHPYQSQTIIRQADGMVLVIPAVTTDYKIFVPGKTEPELYPKTALVYEKRNPLPATYKIGGNFAFFQEASSKSLYLATVTAEGFLTYKGKVNFEPDTIGGNYFTKKGTNELVVVDSYGYYIETGIIASAIRLVGGNFFIDQDGSLTTIKSVGAAPGSNLGLVTKKTGWNFSDALVAGGNYFMKQDGSIVTIDAKNGFFSENAYTPESKPVQLGGNYYIGQDRAVYTISSEGGLFKTITLPSLPITLGYSYMKFADGTFALVTANGGLHTEAVRVGAAGKAEHITKIPASLDIKAVYTPNSFRRN
jgi:hypothetical protein